MAEVSDSAFKGLPWALDFFVLEHLYTDISLVRKFTSSILRNFADILLPLARIFVDTCISLLQIFASPIFRSPEQNVVLSCEISPTSMKFCISNVRNFQRIFDEFSTNFNENKAQISTKFALITFAHYYIGCAMYQQDSWLSKGFVCLVFAGFFPFLP